MNVETLMISPKKKITNGIFR
uniref:Uncharacterized protein n=1 Tax=Tetranychus urticae TaxID=32264 RepID=T1L2X2_TETUR